MSRPAQDVTSAAPTLTGPFWAAAERGELVRPVCGRCGRSFFVPKVCCPYCRSEEWSYRPSSGRGVVYSATIVHRGPDASWPTPYLLAIVDLDEGWSMLTRLLLDVVPAEAMDLIGCAVEVRFVREQREPLRTLPVFVPAPRKEGAAP